MALYIKARADQFLQQARPVNGGYKDIKVELEHPLHDDGRNGQYIDLMITAVAGDALAARVLEIEQALKLAQSELSKTLTIEAEARANRPPLNQGEIVFYWLESDSIKRRIAMLDYLIQNPLSSVERDAFLVEVKPRREPLNQNLRQFKHQKDRWELEEEQERASLGWPEWRRYRAVYWVLATTHEPYQAERIELQEAGVEIIVALSRENIGRYFQRHRDFYE